MSKHIAATVFLFLIQLFVASLAQAQSNDVYNFYFQKAPGPQSVTQTGNTLSLQPNVIAPANQASYSSTVPSAQSAATENPMIKATDLKKPWAVYGGISTISTFGHNGATYDYKGYSLGADYSFSKLLNINAVITYAQSATITGPNPTIDDWEYDYYNYRGRSTNEKRNLKREDPWDVGAGLVVTPIRLEASGYTFLEAAVQAGVITAANDNSVGETSSAVKEQKFIHGYFGPRARVNINTTISLIGDWKFLTDNANSNQFTGALLVRL
jgi:hypothetical protein